MNSKVKAPLSQTRNAIAARKHLALMKASGLIKLVVWVHPTRAQELRAVAKKYRRPVE
jgi:hypothetical protein